MAFSRRDFLKRTCCTAAAGFAAASFNRFGLVNALAQGTQDYKALVCVFLFGGNDSNNMVVPFSSSGYASYQQIRSVLALPQASLLPISAAQRGLLRIPSQIHRVAVSVQPEAPGRAGQRRYAGSSHHPRLNFSSGRPPFPAICSRTKTSRHRCRPPRSTSNGQTGWAGRTADKIQSIYGGNFPDDHFAGGNEYFLRGPYRPARFSPVAIPRRLLSGFGSSAESQSRMSALQNLLTFRHRRFLDPVGQQHYDQRAAGQQVAGGCSGGEAGPGDSLPQQRSGQPTQAGGADHFSALGTGTATADLLRFASEASTLTAINSPRRTVCYTQLSQAMNAFYQATVEIGAASQVTRFTLSDFSRTYAPDSTSGTDHAWGGHHLIMGGAVKGGDFYGTFPTLALAGPDDATDEGRWIPTTSLDQYAATLANWFGVPTADLPTIFPNLPNFSNQLLSFV